LNFNPFLNMNWTWGTNCIALLMAISLNQISRNIIVRIQTSSIKYCGAYKLTPIFHIALEYLIISIPLQP
jgi:hypothetical protein